MPLPVRIHTQQLINGLSQDLQLVPALWRKPVVFRHWLFSARRAQLISLILLLLTPFAIIPLIDLVLSLIFSPVTEETLFGLIKTEKKNPFLDDVQAIAFWLIWILSTLLCAAAFLRHIPDTLDYAKKTVAEKISEADLLISIKPSQSILLYSTAQKWSIDEHSDATLQAKLQNMDATASISGKNPQTMQAKTVILPTLVETSDHAMIAARYQVLKLLGSGAMGNVYRAQDTRLKRDIALKQLAPQLSHDKRILARFRQEALALARLSHPNIVQVYDFIEAEGFFWIVMELVTGGELEEKLQTPDPLPQQEALRLTQQMAEALAYAHEQGVVHRDFKPANVLMTNNGDVKITDFGIAKLTQSSLHTQLNTVMGTPSHMSPEQANGNSTDHRTDIYALGIVLYQMLSNELPFKGDCKSIIAQHLTKKPPGLSEQHENIAVPLDHIVQKMLEKDPDERFQSMSELIKQLAQTS